jgi:hypothetical protein
MLSLSISCYGSGGGGLKKAAAAEYRALLVLGSDCCLTFWLFGPRLLAGGKLDVRAAGRCPLPQPQVTVAWHQRSSTAFTTGFSAHVSAWAVTFHGQRPVPAAGGRRKTPAAREYSFALAQEPAAAAAGDGSQPAAGSAPPAATQARARVLGRCTAGTAGSSSSGAGTSGEGHSEVVQALCLVEWGEDLDTGDPAVLH